MLRQPLCVLDLCRSWRCAHLREGGVGIYGDWDNALRVTLPLDPDRITFLQQGESWCLTPEPVGV